MAGFLGETNPNVITIKNIGSSNLEVARSLKFVGSSQSTSISGIATVTSSQSSASSTAQFNRLQSGLNSGNSIAGMQVVSSSVSVSGGQLYYV